MAILELAMVIGAIVEMATEAVANNLSRSETIIRILKKLGLDSEPPADDFDAIYTYALVEYGVFKPTPILNFFRNRFVRDAFRKAFQENDSSVWDNEAEDIIRWNEETNQLGRIDYDPRREFATFTAAFEAIVARTRAPAEVKRDQKLKDLHQRVGEVIQKLEAMQTLDDIRAMLAQVVKDQGTLAIPAREVKVIGGGIGSVVESRGSGIGLDIAHSGRGPAERITVEGSGIGEIVTSTGTGTGKRIVTTGGGPASEGRVIVNRPVQMTAGMSVTTVITACDACSRTVQCSKVIQSFAGDSEPKAEIKCPYCGASLWI